MRGGAVVGQGEVDVRRSQLTKLGLLTVATLGMLALRYLVVLPSAGPTPTPLHVFLDTSVIIAWGFFVVGYGESVEPSRRRRRVTR